MEVNSTVSGLSDDQLLEQTGKLARLDHQIQVFVIDHLCEIDARQLYLRRGYSSPFDYVTRGLGYSAAAAWRRINAMKLCVRIEGVRERLRDGSLTLDAAAQLQAAFERRDRERAREARSAMAGAGSAARPYRSAPAGPARPSAPKALVEEAAGKSTRQVMQMLAEVDPALVVPADKVRPLSEGRWELKVAIDTECQRGLEQLKGLLTHVDPHMTLGQLVGRLVKEGLERHDPSRPRRSRPTANRTADAERTSAPKQSASPTEITSSPTEARQGQDQERPFLDERVSAAGSAGVHHYFGTEVPRTGRAIPAAVKREIWQRYEGRCGYIDPRTGRRCASRHLLQVDHVFPLRPGRRCGAGQPETSMRGSSPPPPRGAGISTRPCRVNVVDPLRQLVHRRTPTRNAESPSSKRRR